MAKRKSFVDEVLDRRSSLEQRQARASRSLQSNLETVRREAQRRLRRLETFRDPRTGRFVNTELARRTAQAQINDINRVLERELDDATSKLIKQRERAFIQSSLDSRFSIEEATADQARVTTSFSQMFEEAARVSQDAPVLGIKPTNAMRGVLADQQRRTQDILSQAIIKGESIPKTADALSKANAIGKRAATRIARTNLTASAAEANRIIAESDPETFNGYRWDSTFDSRTSAICASLHGRFYPLGSIPPGPPAHPNCRSQLVQEFRDPRVQEFVNEGGRRVRKFDKDGNEIGTEIIKSDESFDKWLRRQPNSVTRKVTGNDVANKLFRNGKVSTKDIVGDDLVPRSPKDIVKRALSRRPNDPQLKKMAKELGIKKPTPPDVIAKGDMAVQAKSAKTIGTRRVMPKADRKRIERLDERKKARTKDVVRAAGRRQAAVTAKKVKRPPKDFELKPGDPRPANVITDVNDPLQKKWIDNLTEAEFQAFDDYTGPFSKQMREVERFGKVSEKSMLEALEKVDISGTPAAVRQQLNERFRKSVRDMEGALNRAPLHEGWSFRGVHDLSPAQMKRFKKGATVDFKSFTSASFDEDVGIEFSLSEGEAPEGSVLFKVYGRGVSVEDLSGIQSEEEILHLKGSRYRVVSVERFGDPEAGEDSFVQVVLHQLIRRR